MQVWALTNIEGECTGGLWAVVFQRQQRSVVSLRVEMYYTSVLLPSVRKGDRTESLGADAFWLRTNETKVFRLLSRGWPILGVMWTGRRRARMAGRLATNAVSPLRPAWRARLQGRPARRARCPGCSSSCHSSRPSFSPASVSRLSGHR